MDFFGHDSYFWPSFTLCFHYGLCLCCQHLQVSHYLAFIFCQYCNIWLHCSFALDVISNHLTWVWSLVEVKVSNSVTSWCKILTEPNIPSLLMEFQYALKCWPRTYWSSFIMHCIEPLQILLTNYWKYNHVCCDCISYHIFTKVYAVVTMTVAHQFQQKTWVRRVQSHCPVTVIIGKKLYEGLMQGSI